jgi:hypothetical protein
MEQVRQSVWIADSLITQYASVMARYMDAWKDDNPIEMSVLRGEIERVYPAIWEHLDQAAATTREAGRSLESYAAVRANPGLERGAAIADVQERVVGMEYKLTKTVVKSELTVRHNHEGVALARQAAAALRATWPELDWTPPAEPDVDLRPRGLFARLFGKR